MELANQVFYLTIALITLGLIFPAYINLNASNGINDDTHYWFYTVIAQFIAAISLSTYPIIGKAGLIIGSTCQYAVDVLLVLFFMSLRKTIHKSTAILLILTIAIAPLFQSLDYAHRTMALVFMMLVLSLWQLYELDAARKRDNSIYLVFLMLVITVQMALGLLRLDHAYQYLLPVEGVPIPNNRFDEPEHELLIRLGIVALYVLIIIGIGNYHFDKLWHHSQRLVTQRENQMLNALNALATARDNETGRHTLRTQHFAGALAKDLKRHGQFPEVLTDKFIDTLFLAAPLHDIGKVGIPDNILLKDGRHTPEESTIMQTHTSLGVGILNAAKIEHEDDVINKAIIIAGTHHERWDGSGYPTGLIGEEIPLAGRIMAIADVYDALTTRRHYKNSWSHKDATEEIIRNKGTHFDPVIVESFERIHEEFELVAERLRDETLDATN